MSTYPPMTTMAPTMAPTQPPSSIPKYIIYRWDVILGTAQHRVPIIYVKPDLYFIDLVQKNDYIIKVLIENTGTIYDGQVVLASVNKSSAVPNCRPNFYNDTGYYIVTLFTDWYGYPTNGSLGSATFLNKV
jgi:hypothetical protein